MSEPRSLGPREVLVDRCDSTNDLARQLAEQGCAAGSWVSAREQTRGRGRQGRSWVGPAGGLYLSVLLRPRVHLSWVPLAVAAAIAEVLDLEIKWPNDLISDGKKVGGILCEASSGFVIAGVGVNCGHAPDEVVLQAQGTHRAALPAGSVPRSADDLRAPLAQAILEGVERLEREGPAEVRLICERRAWLKPGTTVHWGPQGNAVSGTVIGLGSSGELRVSDQNGLDRSLYAEDVHLGKVDED